MENYILILLGALSAIFGYGIGYSVMGVFKGYKKFRDIESELVQLNLTIDNNLKDVLRHIDIESADTFGKVNQIEERIDKENTEIYSFVDSRLDKLETKITKKIPPTNDELSTRIDNLKKELDTFLTLYRNQ
jgi:hemerythrin-like domain-containing protein